MAKTSARASNRQQCAEARLGSDVDHCQGQVDQYQADKEQQRRVAGDRADESQGKQQGAGADQGVVAQGVHKVAAIQAQQRGDDQRTTDQQADLADR
ncbi:hypothetical protein PPS11_09220 [Pseudomonas putida S11]|nr:hypothetical protein PPS11_09220 [Pseudomonas putida S11]